MSPYWHQWHWWIVPVAAIFSWAWVRFLNWIVRPDGTWRWQPADPIAPDMTGKEGKP